MTQACASLAAVITAIDSGVLFYATPVEAHPDAPSVTGEIACRNLVQKGPMLNSPWDFDAVLTLTAKANEPDWSGSVTRIRDYASPFGAKSIIRTVLQNETLSGGVMHCLPLLGSLTGEQRVKFPDGDRWIAELTFRIRIGA
jgi:hypothetical protein